MSKLPRNVSAAYSILQQAIKAAREPGGSGQGIPKVSGAIKGFLHAWKSDPERKAELQRRARFVEERTGPGSPYHEARDAATRAAAPYIDEIDMDRPDGGKPWFPNPKVLLASSVLEPKKGGHIVAATLGQELDDLRVIREESTLPDSVKELIARWRDEAERVELEALELCADGCWYLAHPDAFETILRMNFGFCKAPQLPRVNALLDGIDQGAGDLVGWLEEQRQPQLDTPEGPKQNAEARPTEWIHGWRAIVEAVGIRETMPGASYEELRGKLAHLNKAYGGPIVQGRRGSQPLVERSKLFAWWNDLAEKVQSESDRQRDAEATASAQHPYGAHGVVASDLAGEVRRRP